MRVTLDQRLPVFPDRAGTGRGRAPLPLPQRRRSRAGSVLVSALDQRLAQTPFESPMSTESVRGAL
jgi:hypothetical protein